MSDNGSDQESQFGPTTGFDRYRSLLDPVVTIVVARTSSRPSVSKAGGRELLQSSIEPCSAIKARIAEKGFFLFRVNENQPSGVELPDPQTLVQTGRDGDMT
jgi:hypothetical protein